VARAYPKLGRRGVALQAGGSAPQRGERLLGLRIEDPPGPVRDDASAISVKQRAVEAPLEGLQPLGHRGLGEVQRIRGTLNAARLDCRDERGQLAPRERITFQHGNRDYRHSEMEWLDRNMTGAGDHASACSV